MLAKSNYKYDRALPVKIGGLNYIQFSFHDHETIEKINYECEPFNIDSFSSHCNNLEEIYRTCIDPSGEYPYIFPNVCSSCGLVYYASSKYRDRKNTCGICSQRAAEEIIKTNECKGETSYVYLMKSEKTGLLKIGYSSNPVARAKKLETGNGGKINIVKLIPGGMKLEKLIHGLFSRYNVMNEWYSDVDEIREYFDTIRF